MPATQAQLSFLEAARLVHPARMDELQLPAARIRQLLTPLVRTWQGEFNIEDLCEELPRYTQLVQGIHPNDREDILTTFWRNHMRDLPAWATFTQLVLTIQPSSAAAERVFSIYGATFSKCQEGALADY